MAFDISNFIKPYLPTDKVIEILNAQNQKVSTLSICNYQKSTVNISNLLVFLQDNNQEKQYTFDFPSNSQALSAQILLKNAVNTLKVNCDPTALTPPSPSQTPIPITYLQYKNLQQTSTLFVLQWYDVTDTTDLLGFGSVVYRLLAKTVNDYEPAGIILSTGEVVTITTLDDTIQRFEVGEKKILALNNSKITYDSSSLHLTASTGSILTAVSSNNIDVKITSTATVNNCSYVEVSNNSNVILSDATKVIIENIQQDLSTLGFNLQNVIINQSDSIGKTGKQIYNNPTDFTLETYRDNTDNEIRFTTNNNTLNVILNNKITQANGEFRIKYAGSGTGNIINIYDSLNNLLVDFNDTKKDVWAIFRFNKSTNLYEFVNLDFTDNTSHIVYQVNVTLNGQVSFNLPSPATDPSKLEMFINGQKQLFGPDFTYSNPGIVIYQNRQYTLQIGDEIEFLIY